MPRAVARMEEWRVASVFTEVWLVTALFRSLLGSVGSPPTLLLGVSIRQPERSSVEVPQKTGDSHRRVKQCRLWASVWTGHNAVSSTHPSVHSAVHSNRDVEAARSIRR